jgi:hypothetical protein
MKGRAKSTPHFVMRRRPERQAIRLLKGNYSAPVRAYILAREYRRMK